MWVQDGDEIDDGNYRIIVVHRGQPGQGAGATKIAARITELLNQTAAPQNPGPAPNDVYKDAIKAFGYEQQINMAIEEMAGLTQALLQYKRCSTGAARDHVVEKIADAEIMIQQLRIIYDAADVDHEIEERTKRLAGLIARKKEQMQ